MTPRYRLTRPRRPIDRPGQPRPTATVWVDAPDYDEDGIFQSEGDPALIERIQETLYASYGSRARPLQSNEPLTPRDLAVALDSPIFRPYEPVQLD